MVDKSKNLILIDGNNLLYRFYYALPPFTTSYGQPVGALFGFTRMLIKLLKEPPGYCAVVWDSPKPNIRYTIYPEYKAQRPPTPTTFSSQRKLMYEILEAFSVAAIEVEGEEADDVIATLSRSASREGIKTAIYTGDRDLLQVVSPDISMHMVKKGISEIEEYDRDRIINEWGMTPEQLKDLKTLLGDSSDNIKGLSGIGEKTAKNLIIKYGSIDGIFENLDDLSDKLKKLFLQNREYLRIVQKVIALKMEMDLGFSLSSLSYHNFVPAKVMKVLEKYEFKSLFKEINLPEVKPNLFSMPVEPLFNPQKEIVKTTGKNYLLFIEYADNHPLKVTPAKALVGNPKNPVLINGNELLSEDFLKELKSIFGKNKLQLFTSNYKTLLHFLWKHQLPEPETVVDLSLLLYLYDPAQGGELPFTTSFNYLDFYENLVNVKLNEELLKLYNDIEKPLCRVIALMEQKGIKVDTYQLDSARTEAYVRIRELSTKAYDLAGCNFNLNSPKQVAEILFNKLMLPAYKKGKNGFSTNNEVLKSLEKLSPLVPLIIEHREVSKLISTYLEALPRYISSDTGRIHTTFSQTGTATGRLSSREPNLQNIPTRSHLGNLIRSAFVASKGKILLSGDYSQIELRILAHLSKDPALLQAFTEGEDIHTYTASLLFNTKITEVTREERYRAKTVNFGLIYGMSEYGLSQELNISRSEARQFINRYFLRFPGVKEYLESHVEECKKTGVTQTINGRRRYIPDLDSPNRILKDQAYRIAINTPIQGTAADIIKKAMVTFYTLEQEKKLKSSNLLLQIHDDLLIEVPEEEINYWAVNLKKCMEEAINLIIPIEVHLYSGYNWRDMKTFKP